MADTASSEWAASLNDATLDFALDDAECLVRLHAERLDAARAKARTLRTERERRARSA